MQPSRNNKYWVCVLSDAANRRYEIRLTGDVQILSGSVSAEGARVVYSREFDDTLAAVGYKIALSKLSRRSLERVIRSE